MTKRLEPQTTSPSLTAYPVWDLPTRIFHWVNFLTVLALLAFGFLLMYRKSLYITSAEAKLALKAVHAWIGYVFLANLLVRVVWGFIGNRFARWKAVLPTRQTIRTMGADIAALKARQPLAYLGRGAMGRASITFMFVLFFIQSVTGLIRAGTDLYYPPFGGAIAAYVALPGVDPGTLVPTDESQVDPERYKLVQRLKIPFGDLHIYAAWTILGMIVLHIGSVILKEVRQGGTLVSAMFTGKKVLAVPPKDLNEIEKEPEA